MGKIRNTEFNSSLINNEESYMYYVRRMIDLSIAMFKWYNLPETCDERYIETELFTGGQIAFFDEPDIGLLSLTFTTEGQFNVYGYPAKIRAYSRYNNFTRSLNADEFVPVYNNMTKTDSYSGAIYFAKELWNLDRIISINANAQKTPLFITGTEKDKLTLKNLWKEYDGNAPVIFGYKSLDKDSLQVLNTDSPYIADKIYELKTNIWNEALTYLGIVNVNTTKKERMITDEVNRGLGGTIASRNSRLEARERAVEKINEKFGTDIKVTIRSDETDEYTTENESTEGEDQYDE